MAFDLDAYEPVSVRIAKFYEAHPDGRIITDLVHYLPDVAVFRAEIYIGDTLVATGWEEETRGSSPVNRTSHLANCETSAVGRALANYNLAGSDPTKRPSREEMAKVERSGGQPQAGPGQISPAQIGKIKALCKAADKLPPVNLNDMTKQQASALIDELIKASQEEPF